MRTVVNWHPVAAWVGHACSMLVINRFRAADADDLVSRLEKALAVLGGCEGYVDGRVGRNVDDPSLWVLQTLWTGPGAYRRALSSYDVRVHAWSVLSEAVDEPSAYEVLGSGPLNQAQPRGGGRDSAPR
jgi:hypothetical protein